MNFELPPLPFASTALEPYVDGQTMQIHHDKHHAAYVDNLNKALSTHPEIENKKVWDLLSDLNSLPEDIREKVRNNGGGHANHSFFWKLFSTEFDQSPSETLVNLINASFENFDNFKKLFAEAALSRFGSGWVWVVLDSGGKLVIMSTANQDTPWNSKKDAILGLDVWEHAYYLKYQNKRADYVDAFWHIVNWKQVDENLSKALSYLS